MRPGSILAGLRRGRQSFAVATLYVLLLPILLGILPKPAATAEFLLLRDLATAELCTLPGSAKAPGQLPQHQPDCILCAPGCTLMGSTAAPPPVLTLIEPFFLHFTRAERQPQDFALPALGLFTSDIQSRGPPRLV